MPRRIHTSIVINASPARVWATLTDFSSFPEWNPFIRRLRGTLAFGARLEAFIQPPGTGGMTIRPTLTEVARERELRWRGRLLLPGVFDGEHLFQIERLDDDRVRFVQSETFRGLLVPLLWRTLDRATRRGFEEMNRALKARAEA